MAPRQLYKGEDLVHGSSLGKLQRSQCPPQFYLEESLDLKNASSCMSDVSESVKSEDSGSLLQQQAGVGYLPLWLLGVGA